MMTCGVDISLSDRLVSWLVNDSCNGEVVNIVAELRSVVVVLGFGYKVLVQHVLICCPLR